MATRFVGKRRLWAGLLAALVLSTLVVMAPRARAAKEWTPRPATYAVHTEVNVPIEVTVLLRGAARGSLG